MRFQIAAFAAYVYANLCRKSLFDSNASSVVELGLLRAFFSVATIKCFMAFNFLIDFFRMEFRIESAKFAFVRTKSLEHTVANFSIHVIYERHGKKQVAMAIPLI